MSPSKAEQPTTGLKALMVTTAATWCRRSGGEIRASLVAEGLSGVGTLDIFLLSHHEDDERRPGPLPWRIGGVPARDVGSTPAALAKWLLLSRLPKEVWSADHEATRHEFRRWTAGRSYDLVWYTGLEALAALGKGVSGRRILDLWDLEDLKLLGELRLREPVPALSTTWHRLLRDAHVRVNARRWRRAQVAAAAAVDAVAVCSEVDAGRLGAGNAMVVPNGYPRPATMLGRRIVGSPPAVLFAGRLDYLPNLDAAHQLAVRVGPLLRARLPDARIRLVGAARAAGRLHDPPRVTVTGFVPDILPELARADVVAVPIRFAGGTRLKVLEAFAHGIPVVSTTVGAEGLGVEDGHHLLIAETPAEFADACVRVLTDSDLRASLTRNAHKLYLDCFEATKVVERVATVARTVVQGSADGVAP